MKIIFLICTNPSLEHLKNTHKRIQLTIAITTWYTLFKVQNLHRQHCQKTMNTILHKIWPEVKTKPIHLGRGGLAIGRIPGGLAANLARCPTFFFLLLLLLFFIYILLLLLFCCLPNVLKWLFPNSPFNNKTHVIYREWVSLDWQRDSPRARSAPPRVRQKDASL